MIVAGFELARIDPVALLAQHPAGLGARVVELAGLADDDRPGADDEDRLDVGALRHQRAPPSACAVHQLARTRRTGSAASWGPGPASGWYCTLKAGHVGGTRMPSITPSLRLTWVTSALGTEPSADREVVVLAGDLDRAGARGAAPGGCRRGGRTGSLTVAPPSAVASSWWPRQMPKTGTSPSRPPDGLDGVGHGGRVAGTVGQEHAVGLAGQHVGGGRGRPARPRPWPMPARWRRIVRLDAEVVGDDARTVAVADACRARRW